MVRSKTTSSRLVLICCSLLACLAFVFPSAVMIPFAVGATPIGTGETLQITLDPPEDAIFAVICGTTDTIEPILVAEGCVTVEIHEDTAPVGTALTIGFYTYEGVLLAEDTLLIGEDE